MTTLSGSKLERLLKATNIEEFLEPLELKFRYSVDDLKLSEFVKYDYDSLDLLDFSDSEKGVLLDVFKEYNRCKEERSSQLVRNFCKALRLTKDKKTPHESKKKNKDEYYSSVLTELQARLKKYTPNDVQLGREEGFSLFSAVITGHQDCIENMLKKDPKSLNKANCKGWTPLMYSLAQGCSDGTNSLLKAGADVKAINKNGMNALGLGASYGHRSTIRNFLKLHRELKGTAGVKTLINQPDHNGRIALHYAAENRQWEACEVLMNFGSDPNQKDKNGETSMFLACESQNSATIRALYTKGGDPHIANNDGKTGYMVVADKRKYLLEEDGTAKKN